jgi:hypothetical protein
VVAVIRRGSQLRPSLVEKFGTHIFQLGHQTIKFIVVIRGEGNALG